MKFLTNTDSSFYIKVEAKAHNIRIEYINSFIYAYELNTLRFFNHTNANLVLVWGFCLQVLCVDCLVPNENQINYLIL